jgi:3-hydroxyisobutyrate dehydrogenase-like beta-hydroxyacid dehydrogenase
MKRLCIGFVGLGVMGEPMCRNMLTKSGHRFQVHDLDEGPVRRLVEAGAVAAGGAAAAVRGADIVFLSLPSGRALAEIAHGPAGILREARAGQIVVDLGTSSVKLTRDLASAFSAQGARYLDAPVARTREAANAGTLSVMVGGDPATLEEIKPLLACVATDITFCGATGSGQATKILNNMVLFQTVAALSEAYAIARQSGFDPRLIFDTLTKGSGDSFALRNHGAKAIIPQEFPLRAFSVEYAKKDLSYALELAAETGVDAAGARRVDHLFDQAIGEGLGGRYFPVVSQVVSATATRAPDTHAETTHRQEE